MALVPLRTRTSIRTIHLEPGNENLGMEFEENERKRRHEMEIEKMKHEQRMKEFELAMKDKELELAKLTLELEKVKIGLKIQTKDDTSDRDKRDAEKEERIRELKKKVANLQSGNTDQLYNVSAAATGVTVACGAVTGFWGGVATVGAMGAAFGVATAVAPVAGTLAVASGIGWVYKKTRST